jgi:phosphatidylglycerophosphate synthase
LTFTIAIARPEHRDLLRSALSGILAVALATVSLGVLESSRLHLSGAYLPKVLLVFAAGATLLLLALPSDHPSGRIGAANVVTIVRGALVALLAGLAGERATDDAAASAVIIAFAVTVLDGVDGWLARRAGTASAFGARFDMETDAVFVAVLALLVWQFGKAGPWVLLSGLMRYLFVASARMMPRLRRPVPSTYRGKSIAVLQMIALIVALSPACSSAVASAVAAIALLALTLSFTLDIAWLLRQPLPHGH